MPELPEVETIKNAVQMALKNAEILEITVHNPHLRRPVPADLPEKARHTKITGYQRIAKYIVISLDNGLSLILHLGMSGTIRLSDERGESQKHDHIVFRTTEGYMVYNDPRRFGLCVYVPTESLKSCSLLKNSGTDPFDEQLTGTYLKEKLTRKNLAVKLALLDQKIISGIGNIYASEALFLAGILPTRPANSLSLEECERLVEKVRETLTQAIKAGGSTLRDYKRPDGSLGYFQNSHCVYNKTGKPCPDCTCRLQKTGGIQKIAQGGRSTYFCATKQR